VKRRTHCDLINQTLNCLGLLLLPLLLSGCLTANTITFATHEHTYYLHEQVKQVKQAAVTPDSKLVLWMDGKMAGAEHRGKYTVTASLHASTSLSPARDMDHATIRRRDIVEGWDTNAMKTPELFPVAVAPLVVLPDHEDTYKHRAQFNGIEGADRSVYVVESAAHDINLDVVYVDNGRVPRKTFFNLETKHVQVPHRYYLFLWLPVTIPVDAATLPLQLLMWPMWASIKC